ncbi:hypothetical protein ERO13_A09G093500v2 [Gossypium hirsutum]|nr:hypothetical protein ERO13_A09G093500v2 [Gossypium hirsutum]
MARICQRRTPTMNMKVWFGIVRRGLRTWQGHSWELQYGGT